MVKIKICGITCEEEIVYINKLNPDYIGFVFTKSKRQITLQCARKLSCNLSENIKVVGVFRNNSLEEVIEAINLVDLDIVQLHGSENEDFILSLKNKIDKDIEIWKAISIHDEDSILKYLSYMVSIKDSFIIDKFLIDGDNPGSGESFSIRHLEELLRRFDNRNVRAQNEFFIAGGINPYNVLDKINSTTPYGIDVSSGVEDIDKNGNLKKSYKKMKELICKVRKDEI